MGAFFNDVEVLWIARFDYKPDWILTDHKHKDFFQIIYCMEGSCTVSLDEGRYDSVSPVLLFLPPGTKHGFPAIGKGGMKTLDTKFIIHSKRLARHCMQLPHIVTTIPDSIYDLLASIRREGSDKKNLYQEHCQLMLGEILMQLIRSQSQHVEEGKTKKSNVFNTFVQNKKLSPVSRRFVSYVKQNFQNKITAEMLEQNLNYSYRYISKVVKKETGMTPFEFIERYRIVKAEELLNYSDFELKHICEIVGFNDIHQFSKTFKKNAGISPGRWRKNAQAEIWRDILIHSDFKNELFIRQL